MIQRISCANLCNNNCVQKKPSFSGALSKQVTSIGENIIDKFVGSELSESGRFLASLNLEKNLLPLLEKNSNISCGELAKSLKVAITKFKN